MNISLEEKFLTKISKYEFAKNETVVVAVSGGADSMALSMLMKKYSQEKEINVICVTIDHGLRLESAKEAQKLSVILKTHNIYHKIIRWEGKKPFSNIQSHARKARYDLLTKFCREREISKLFVAHNKGDISETFLINLERGSGLDGLASIREITIKNEVEIIRPLLDVAKDQLESYLTQNNIEWIQDPSNENEKFTRVRIRKKLAADHVYANRIALAANHLREAKTFIDRKIQEEMAQIVEILDLGIAKLDFDKFLKLGEYELMTILTNTLKIISGNFNNPRFDSLKAVLYKLKNKSTSGELLALTLMGCKIQIFKKRYILIYREDKNIQEIEVTKPQELVWDRRFRINFSDKSKYPISIKTLGKRGWQTLDKNSISIPEEYKDIPKSVFYSLPFIQCLENEMFIPYLSNKGDEYKIKCQFISDIKF